MCAMSWCELCEPLNLALPESFLLQHNFFKSKAIFTAVIVYYMYFYLVVISIDSVLQLINRLINNFTDK